MMNLSGKTLFITGASRGIGRAIALRAARDGAQIIIAAKTADPHPTLPGTVYSAAADIEAAGGKALPCIVDIRSEEMVQNAIDKGIERFGGIDILVNNASAISLTGTEATSMKRFDLMHQVNTRGTFLCSKLCLPHLRKADNPHILSLSPPLTMRPHWFASHTAYTIAKYGMSMCVLGMATEFKDQGIAVNALWPKTAIDTAALRMITGIRNSQGARSPEIVADAAHWILTQASTTHTGNFHIDEEVLCESGTTDFDKYSVNPDQPLVPDLFIDP